MNKDLTTVASRHQRETKRRKKEDQKFKISRSNITSFDIDE